MLLRRRFTSAFSLAELIVVVAIISLLFALLLPALQRARIQSQWLVCQSNLRTVGQEMLIYSVNNRGWLFPPDNGLDVPMNERWFVPVLRHIPLDTSDLSAENWIPPILLCPADDPNPGEHHSYLINHHLAEHNVSYSSKPPGGLSPNHLVLMGEKLTSAQNYFVEILQGQTTYYDQVEKYRHGIHLGSNFLYLDLHVDNHGPTTSTNDLDPWDFPEDK